MTATTFADLYKEYETEDKIENLPEGEYVLEVATAKNVAAKSYIQPVFKVVGGPSAGKKVLAGVLSYKETARSMFFQKLEGFGLDKSYFAQNPSGDDVAKALVGRQVKVFLSTQKEGQYAGRNELPVKGITLVSAPQLPGIGGTPVAAAPPAAAPAAAAPAPVAAAPVVETPAAPPAATPPPPAPPAAAGEAAVVIDDPGF